MELSEVCVLQSEWVVRSKVDAEIVRNNVDFLKGDRLLEFLLGNTHQHLGAHSTQYATVPMSRAIARLDPIAEEGGWACQGLEPLSGWERMDWGCLKPLSPRIDSEGKIIKYEHPAKMPTRAFWLDCPSRIWQAIAKNHDAEMPSLGGGEAWQWWIDQKLPIVITEGAKKAGRILTLGYAAIGIPGVWNGSPKNDQGIPLLSPDLDYLAGDRGIIFAFDQDDRRKTRKTVTSAKKRLTKLFLERNSSVFWADWNPALGKGIDDIGDDDAIESLTKTKSYTKDNIDPAPSFCMVVADKLYDDRWICFESNLYKWYGNYYKLIPDCEELNRIKVFAENYAIETKQGLVCAKATPKSVRESLEWIKIATGIDKLTTNGINCKNGVLEWRWEGKKLITSFVKHDPKRHFFTIEPIFAYDPNAPKEHLDDLLNCLDLGTQKILVSTIASGLDLQQIRKFHSRCPRALLLQGSGSNGKDTIREMISLLLKGRVKAVSTAGWLAYDQGRAFPVYPIKDAAINWPSENTDVGLIEKLMGLRAAITGDEIVYERKGKDAEYGSPQCVFLFNCNEKPTVLARMAATTTRWYFIRFKRTYKDDPGPGELKANPAFKSDPEFIAKNILPAFLNRLLSDLQSVAENGIDYSAGADDWEELQRSSSHLLQFVSDSGLTERENCKISIRDLWAKLQDWYVNNGTLIIEEGPRGGKKNLWVDQADSRDRNVTGLNQISKRFLELFPNIKISTERTSKGTVTWLNGVDFVEVYDDSK